MEKRERWGSRIGLILAMAGNAVGLGNFLRFPVQAAQNGGGAFMIPYFIAFLLLAIPLMWIEWSIGRHGGKFKHGSLPGMFDAMWSHPISKYLGVFGLFVSTIIVCYYTYIESWTLGFSFFSLSHEYFGMTDFDSMGNFLKSYQGVETGHFSSIAYAYVFLLITMAMNFYVLWRGISKGIETFAKIAMPLLLGFGVFLAIWVFTVGTPDPVNHPDWNIESGLAFIWNPNFEMLSSSRIWLAAAGQVFFTLSVGMGTLQAYASYLRKDDDIALSGLATASLNEFSEVVLGGSIAIPIAVAFFGIAGTTAIAQGGSFDLGFISMPVIFQQIPGMGAYLGFMWFFLLFFAGITSSVAMAQPLISFLKEQFKFSHKKATIVIASLIFIAVHFVVMWQKFGFLDELDYWAGTFSLVIVALLEVIIFVWIYDKYFFNTRDLLLKQNGGNVSWFKVIIVGLTSFNKNKNLSNTWTELNKGSDIKIPSIFYFIMKFVTPIYLLVILGFWLVQDAIPTLMMEGVNEADIMYRWAARGFMLLILIILLVMINRAWARNSNSNVQSEEA